MIDLGQLRFIGRDLQRPECVLTAADGARHVADWRGGVTVIAADGAQRTVLAKGDFKPRPNGIALIEGGWLLTHLGEEDGGVYRLGADGELSPFLLAVDGVPLPPTNYVHVETPDRVWITVSTRRRPRIQGCRPDCDDGFIVLAERSGARIVADGLGYTNECLVHPIDGGLYVNETFGRRLSRFDIDPGGGLSNRRTIAEFGLGEFPDGLAFDAEGGIWVTSIVSNRVIRIAPDGDREIVLEDSDPQFLARVEAAFVAGQLAREHLDRVDSRYLKNTSSVAFGGADLKTVYLGCLLGGEIAYFRSPIAGLPPAHWRLPEVNWIPN